MKKKLLILIFTSFITLAFADINEKRLIANQKKVEQFLNKGNYIKYNNDFYPKSAIQHIECEDTVITIDLFIAYPNGPHVIRKMDLTDSSYGDSYLNLILDDNFNLIINKINEKPYY